MTQQYDPHKDWDHTKHVLVSASYEGSTIPSSDVANAVSRLFSEYGVDGVILMSYTQKYFTHPLDVSLKDAWMSLTGDQITRLPMKLRHAIEHMLGVPK